jgi:hypothetical protein
LQPTPTVLRRSSRPPDKKGAMRYWQPTGIEFDAALGVVVVR